MSTITDILAGEKGQELREKLRIMSVNELTDDTRIIRVFLKFSKRSGGTLEDFAALTDRNRLLNWGKTSEAKFEAALTKLLAGPYEVETETILPRLDLSLENHLRAIGMDSVSTIVRLNTCYNASRATNLYEFAYKTKRMRLRNWGAKSEREFILALHKYLSSWSNNGTQVAEAEQATTLEQEMSLFLKLENETLKYFYLSHFNEIQDSIQSKGSDMMVVSQIAAEIGATWPYRYRTRLLKEYIYPDKNKIFKTRGLGKKKRRSVILCLIWAAKGSQRDLSRYGEMSPNELMKTSPLSAKEKQALTLRFLGEEPRTLAEAARIMNVTRERVRQHQKTAETKLRTLGINQFAREWLRQNSSKIWTMLSNDDGATVEPKNLPGGYRKCVPGEVLLATVLAGWTLDDVLSLEGDPIDDWWSQKAKA
jgi:DNA-binding CsgD family transcriptional regulator